MDLCEDCSPEQALRELEDGYGSPGRHYHTFGHVWSCLLELDRVRSLCGSPLALELAVWFHDAVYDPQAGDNEDMLNQPAPFALQLKLQYSDFCNFFPTSSFGKADKVDRLPLGS